MASYQSRVWWILFVAFVLFSGFTTSIDPPGYKCNKECTTDEACNKFCMFFGHKSGSCLDPPPKRCCCHT
ncbi:unnamed protein product [Lathyrus oleraceus]